MTNSSKSLKVLLGPSSRFQGPLCHGPGPASWPMELGHGWWLGYCIIPHPRYVSVVSGGHLGHPSCDVPGTLCDILVCVSYLPYIYLLPNLEIYLNVE